MAAYWETAAHLAYTMFLSISTLMKLKGHIAFGLIMLLTSKKFEGHFA